MSGQNKTAARLAAALAVALVVLAAGIVLVVIHIGAGWALVGLGLGLLPGAPFVVAALAGGLFSPRRVDRRTLLAPYNLRGIPANLRLPGSPHAHDERRQTKV